MYSTTFRIPSHEWTPTQKYTLLIRLNLNLPFQWLIDVFAAYPWYQTTQLEYACSYYIPDTTRTFASFRSLSILLFCSIAWHFARNYAFLLASNVRYIVASFLNFSLILRLYSSYLSISYMFCPRFLKCFGKATIQTLLSFLLDLLFFTVQDSIP